MDEDEEMPATLEDPAADEEETRALVEAFEAEQAAQEAQVRDSPDHSHAIAMHTNALSSQTALCTLTYRYRPAMLEHVSALVGVGLVRV